MRLLAVAAGLAGRDRRRPGDRPPGGRIRRRAGDRRARSGRRSGQQTFAGVLAVAPAIVVGAVGPPSLAVALSALTPRGLARRRGGRSRRADRRTRRWRSGRRGQSWRSASVIARRRHPAIGATACRRHAAVLRPAPAASAPPGCSGSPWRRAPDGADGVAAGGAIVATAMGVAGVLGVWSFEAGRDHLVAEGRLFGVDADLAWRRRAGGCRGRRRRRRVEPWGRRRRRALGARRRPRARRARRSRPPGNPSAFDPIAGWAVRRSSAAARRPDRTRSPSAATSSTSSASTSATPSRSRVTAARRADGGRRGDRVGQDEVDDGIRGVDGRTPALSHVTCDGPLWLRAAPAVRHRPARRTTAAG